MVASGIRTEYIKIYENGLSVRGRTAIKWDRKGLYATLNMGGHWDAGHEVASKRHRLN